MSEHNRYEEIQRYHVYNVGGDDTYCRDEDVAELEASHADLLAALKRIYALPHECPCEVSDDLISAYSQARAAIAKAEGKEEQP